MYCSCNGERVCLSCFQAEEKAQKDWFSHEEGYCGECKTCKPSRIKDFLSTCLCLPIAIVAAVCLSIAIVVKKKEF